MKRQKKRFWHIDYITTRRDAAVRAVYLSPYLECETLGAVSLLGSFFGRKLGSSDCTCRSHFVKLNQARLEEVKSSLTLERFEEYAG